MASIYAMSLKVSSLIPSMITGNSHLCGVFSRVSHHVVGLVVLYRYALAFTVLNAPLAGEQSNIDCG